MISSWLNTKEVYFPPNAILRVQHAPSGARRPEGTHSNHRNKQTNKQNKNPVQSPADSLREMMISRLLPYSQLTIVEGMKEGFVLEAHRL